jgi:hypothetical protein
MLLDDEQMAYLRAHPEVIQSISLEWRGQVEAVAGLAEQSSQSRAFWETLEESIDSDAGAKWLREHHVSVIQTDG